MEKLDKETYLKRVIVVCWIALAICFGIKLFGGNLFEIMCENENFIKVCEYADNHWWADIVISGFTCFVHLYFFALAICQKIKFCRTELLVVLCTAMIGTALKILFTSMVGIIFDIWQLVLLPVCLVWREKRKILNVVIANVLLFAFQAISMITKNIDFGILGDSILVGTIYSLDVVLMIILYYGYANVVKRKEG